MQQKIKRVMFVVITIMLSANAVAQHDHRPHDFSVDGIYYRINSDSTTVAVTDFPEGAVIPTVFVIPEEVEYNGITYTVTRIDDYIMENSDSLISVTIPRTITEVRYGPFRNCPNLTEINYNAINCVDGLGFAEDISSPGWKYYSRTNWLSGSDNIQVVNIGNGVQRIPNYFMYHKYHISSIIIPNSVTHIGDRAFYENAYATHIEIGDSVTYIGFEAFCKCRNITSIILPSTLTMIAGWAFEQCSLLDTIVCLAENPPTLGDFVFSGVPLRDVILKVPCNRIEAYHTATPVSYYSTGWNSFFHIIDDCGNAGINEITEERLLQVYPNPAKENITLETEDDIFIFNSFGQEVKQVKATKGKTIINISNLPQGIYYLKTGNKRQKLVKQ